MAETTNITTETPAIEEPVLPYPEDDKTTLPCKKVTRIRIKDYGKKGESYDHLINRILNELDELRKK